MRKKKLQQNKILTQNNKGVFPFKEYMISGVQ